MSVFHALRVISRYENSDLPLHVYKHEVERAEVVLFDARRYRDMARASMLLEAR